MHRTSLSLRAVKLAAEFLKTQFQRGLRGKKKPDGTLVSDADYGSEKIILSMLNRAFPKDGILSEESAEQASQNGYRWILDPLDGTHNFLHGLPLFGTLLALEWRGKVIFSICAFPMINEFFVAEKGKGASLNGKPIRVSTATTLRGGMCFIDGNKKLPLKRIFTDIEGVVSSGCRWRMCGSSEFAMTRIARGDALISLSRFGTPWDNAAPAFLVEEAGGKVTDSSGKPWTIHSKNLIVSNRRVHRAALKLFGV